MELEFDKEIDSLLRKADRGVLVGDKPDGKLKDHLDADELAAFAENAMPEKVRALHMEHLADCGRCRGVLSGLIMLNAEAEPESSAVAAPPVSVAVEPWYRKLLLYPNLAYVMGGLVLMFGGLLTFSLLQNSGGIDAVVVSQVSESEAGRGPMAPESAMDSTANISANTMSSTNFNSSSPDARVVTSNTASNSAIASPPKSLEQRREEVASGKTTASEITADGVDSKSREVAAPPPAPASAPKDAELAMSPGALAKEADDKNEAKKRAAVGNEKADLSINSRQMQDLPRTQAGGPLKAKPGPSRDAQQNFPNRANNTFEMNEERKVGLRGFQRKNNVWYDNSYRGQTTKNVRRGTDEYKDLDSGLRAIAESLGGVVVVVWEGKAYRIQ